MRITSYFIATMLFIVSVAWFIFAPLTKENLDISESLFRYSVMILCFSSTLDFIKYLLRMGEYSTTK